MSQDLSQSVIQEADSEVSQETSATEDTIKPVHKMSLDEVYSSYLTNEKMTEKTPFKNGTITVETALVSHYGQAKILRGGEGKDDSLDNKTGMVYFKTKDGRHYSFFHPERKLKCGDPVSLAVFKGIYRGSGNVFLTAVTDNINGNEYKLSAPEAKYKIFPFSSIVSNLVIYLCVPLIITFIIFLFAFNQPGGISYNLSKPINFSFAIALGIDVMLLSYWFIMDIMLTLTVLPSKVKIAIVTANELISKFSSTFIDSDEKSGSSIKQKLIQFSDSNYIQNKNIGKIIVDTICETQLRGLKSMDIAIDSSVKTGLFLGLIQKVTKLDFGHDENETLAASFIKQGLHGLAQMSTAHTIRDTQRQYNELDNSIINDHKRDQLMKDQTSAESHKRDLDEKERKASIIKISGFKTIAEIELLLSNGEKETFVVDYDKSMSAWNQSDNISLIQSKYKKGEDSQAHVEYLINHTNGDIITCNALLSDDSELTIEALSQRFNLPVKKTRLTAWTPNIPIIIGCALYFMIINKFSADINWSVIVNEHGRNSFLVCLGMIVMLPANVIIMQKLNIRFAIVNNYNILKSIHSNCATSLKAAIIGINK